jgi:hypothetical protein
MADIMTLPMLGSIQLAPISSHQMKRIMAQLSGQQERLATDLPYFKQQTGVMLQAAVHLCSDRKVCLGKNHSCCLSWWPSTQQQCSS